MKFRFCTILLGLLILQLVCTLACGKCGEQRYFSVLDLFVESSRVLSQDPITVEELDLNEYVKIEDFTIVLTTGVEYVDNQHFNFLTPFSFQTAVASCDTEPLPAQQITTLHISSNADFIFTEEVYAPAGQNLNQYFVVSYGDQLRIPVIDFLSSGDSHPMEVPLYFFIDGEAAYNQLHRFHVKYVLSDGQTFDASTEKVIITPN